MMGSMPWSPAFSLNGVCLKQLSLKPHRVTMSKVKLFLVSVSLSLIKCLVHEQIDMSMCVKTGQTIMQTFSHIHHMHLRMLLCLSSCDLGGCHNHCRVVVFAVLTFLIYFCEIISRTGFIERCILCFYICHLAETVSIGDVMIPSANSLVWYMTWGSQVDNFGMKTKCFIFIYPLCKMCNSPLSPQI